MRINVKIAWFLSLTVVFGPEVCHGTYYRNWENARVAFLGDSITDKRHIGCETNYWGFLSERTGLKAFSYGINGSQMSNIPRQVSAANAEMGGNVDAVFILSGTNDFNANVPIGELYTETEESVRKDAEILTLRHRQLSFEGATFCGRVNAALKAAKTTFPTAQVVLLTPPHRGFAQFGEDNVQPDESYANANGLYIDDYVRAIRKAGELWSVPVIDLYAECGIVPTLPEYDVCIANPEVDRLHPSTVGHDRIARVIEMHLCSMPSTFSGCPMEGEGLAADEFDMAASAGTMLATSARNGVSAGTALSSDGHGGIAVSIR